MYELGFESHINDFESIQGCTYDSPLKLKDKAPSLKAEIQTMDKDTKNLKKQIEGFNKEFELFFNKFKFNMEKETFIKLKPGLLKEKKYINKYVAIHNGKIIGYDSDKMELLKYIYRKIGYQPIYIDKVTEEKIVYTFSSPREKK